MLFFDPSHSAAMNMDEWQRKLREEKKKEREQKTQSAEMLHVYRGDVNEEDLKLSALRQEERQKHQDAEKMLHDFRNDDMGDIKQRPQREELSLSTTPVKASTPGQAVEVTPGQSVASLKDKFGAVAETELAPSEVPVTEKGAPVVADASSGQETEGLPSEGAVSSMARKFTESAAATTATDAAKVAPTPFDGEEKKEATDDFLRKAAAEVPSVVRLDVLVSFGLLTGSDNPELYGYTKAAEKIVQNKLASTPALSEVEYDPEFQPYVKSSKLDTAYEAPADREDLRRQLVVAGVPVFMPNDTALEASRESIVEALKEAIDSGEFVELALKYN